MQQTSPAATKNVSSVAISPTTGAITITYDTSIDAGATLILSPVDGSSTAGTALGGSTTSSTIPTAGSITWLCKSVGSTNANTAAAKGTIKDKYVPANCRT